MIYTKAENIACPMDGEKLVQHDNCLSCENGHSFDIAKQGYVNLLPVQHMRSKQPGDSKAMVVARSEFLNSGFYELIANKLADISLIQISAISDEQTVCLMDAGCGEGYYLDYILNQLKDHVGETQLSFIGLDISKPAIIASSKRNKSISWIVGTNRKPPVVENSVDIILCVFGFQSFDGFHRSLKQGGSIILVEPGPDHLKELREIIYTDVKKTDVEDLSQYDKTGFSIVDTCRLQFNTGEINNEQINNLLLMTPHFFRANKEGRERAINLTSISLSVDVVFRVLKASDV